MFRSMAGWQYSTYRNAHKHCHSDHCPLCTDNRPVVNDSLAGKDKIMIFAQKEFSTMGVATITDTMPDKAFCVAGYSIACPDKPSQYPGCIFAYRLGGSYRVILAIDYQRGVYLRTLYAGTWTGWRTLFANG